MTSDDGDPRVVPVYALTGGRGRSTADDLALETMVSSTDHGLDSLPDLRFEHARIVDLCRRPQSVVEVAAELGVPVGVARVLVSDLHGHQLLAVHRLATTADGTPAPEILERLLAGLRARPG